MLYNYARQMDGILREWRPNKGSVHLYSDFEKAFDKVPHSGVA